MARPSLSQHERGLHTGKIGFFQDFIVGSVVLLSNVHDGEKAALLFQAFDLLSEQYTCLDPLREGIDDNSLIYQNFGGEAKRGVLCEGEHYLPSLTLPAHSSKPFSYSQSLSVSMSVFQFILIKFFNQFLLLNQGCPLIGPTNWVRMRQTFFRSSLLDPSLFRASNATLQKAARLLGVSCLVACLCSQASDHVTLDHLHAELFLQFQRHLAPVIFAMLHHCRSLFPACTLYVSSEDQFMHINPTL